MTATLALLLWAAQEQIFDALRDRTPPEVAVERVKACGFKHVRIREDRDLQEDVIEISAVSHASALQFRCVAQQSLASIMYVEFPARLQAKYAPVYYELERAVARAEARAWLEKRGLLTKLPTYEKGKVDDLDFARKLEALCGRSASGAFIRDRGIVTLKPGMIDDPPWDNATFECLLNVSEGSGFPIGIIGNEYDPPKKK